MKPGTIVGGSFKQQSAAVYIGLGFIPDWVKVIALTTDTLLKLEWNVNMRTIAAIEGTLRSTMTDADWLDLAIGEGVAIYRGGTKISSTSTPSTTTYLAKEEDADKRDAGSGDEIDTWTLGSSTNKTGSWNDVCATATVGVGSRICVDGKWATVTALTSNGEQANEVTLNEALKSGTIEYLSNMYDWVAQDSATVAKAGFVISDTTYLLDATSDYMIFEAGLNR